MLENLPMSLILSVIFGAAIALWAIFFSISKDLRDMITFWRRKISKNNIIATTREEYERIREQNRLLARSGKKVKPVFYIHLDSDLKCNIILLNIFTFVVIVLSLMSLILLKNYVIFSITVGSFFALIFLYFYFGISLLKKF